MTSKEIVIRTLEFTRPERLARSLPEPWGSDFAHIGPATGDLVAADGDGVIVVPIEHVECVLTQARRIANGDRAGRRKLFAAAGKPQDGTTAELP